MVTKEDIERKKAIVMNDINSVEKNTTAPDTRTSAENSQSVKERKNRKIFTHSQNVTPEVLHATENEAPIVRRYSHHSGAALCKQPKPIPYLIKGYMRKGGLGMIHGESGCGKSFAVIDMAASIASEEISDWHGIPLHHGQVIYFAGEGADGLNARLASFCNERNINPDSLKLEVIDEIFKLDCGKEDTAHSLENTIAEIKSYGETVLVVFDTVNIYMKAEENSNTDVGNFCQMCRKIIQECGCTVLLVHHTGLSPEAKNRGRGASSLKGAVDFELHLKKDIDILTLSTPKIKDGKEQTDLIFKLTEHEIPDWYDEDGEAITSCTIELAKGIMEYREKEQAEKKKPKLKPAQQYAFDTFKEAAKQYGEIIVDNPETGHESIWLEDSEWGKYFKEHLPKTNDDLKKDKENKRVKYYNAKKFMTTEGKLLTIQRKAGHEYYCLDLSGNTDTAYRIEIRDAIKNRKDSGNKNDKAEAETDTTHGIPFDTPY